MPAMQCCNGHSCFDIMCVIRRLGHHRAAAALKKQFTISDRRFTWIKVRRELQPLICFSYGLRCFIGGANGCTCGAVMLQVRTLAEARDWESLEVRQPAGDLPQALVRTVLRNDAGPCVLVSTLCNACNCATRAGFRYGATPQPHWLGALH
jgi:hypothetical protein